MGFDLKALEAAVVRYGRVARVVVAEVAGSTPRDVGASMLVWEGGQSGTIGGGALEYEAAQAALHRDGVSRHPLGPQLGQCCGGSVTLLTEIYDAARIAGMHGQEVIARGPGHMPLAVHRMLSCARGQGVALRPRMVQGWFVEPVARPTTDLWIWGAGHVGRALVDVLAPLPGLAITWVDTDRTRYPDVIAPGVTLLPAAEPVLLVPRAPVDAQHLILTYSHALDLSLCHALLHHGFDWAGLIGSDTKWARFRKRLQALGHGDAQITCICCPIGQKSLGKHPYAIAIGVAAQLVERQQQKDRDGCQTAFLTSTG